MNGLYIGICTPGTTSLQRALTLQRIRPDIDWNMVDTDEHFFATWRPVRSIGFRTKRGPLVWRINRQVQRAVAGKRFDVIWVDKAIYLSPTATRTLRAATKVLIHYTPDCAFFANRSPLFETSLRMYDLLVTTKSFELEAYWKRAERSRVHLVTQGFDPTVHRVLEDNFDRAKAACFIGLFEPERGECVKQLTESGIAVWVGGKGWDRFVDENRNSSLNFLGEAIFGEDYVRTYNQVMVGLGLLSKRFPERHTTRTFEIPACGCILATERTEDTGQFFDENDVIFYDDYPALTANLRALFNDPHRSRQVAAAGHRKAVGGGFDYASILARILDNSGLPAYTPAR